jgi:type IV pilus assembly protein PilE
VVPYVLFQIVGMKNMHNNHWTMRMPQQGFTLIELMVVVAIVAILAMIAIPSYQTHTRKAIAGQAQQEIQKLAEQLERHKGKNFSYLGFDPSYLYKDNSGNLIGYSTTNAQLNLPLNSSGTAVKYIVSVRDGTDTTKLLTNTTALGQRWAIKAESQDPNNFTFLMTSTGIQCKNQTRANVSYTGCGTGGVNTW